MGVFWRCHGRVGVGVCCRIGIALSFYVYASIPAFPLCCLGPCVCVSCLAYRTSLVLEPYVPCSLAVCLVIESDGFLMFHTSRKAPAACGRAVSRHDHFPRILAVRLHASCQYRALRCLSLYHLLGHTYLSLLTLSCYSSLWASLRHRQDLAQALLPGLNWTALSYSVYKTG